MNTPLERLEIARLASFIVLDPEKNNKSNIEYRRMPQSWLRVALRSQTKLADYLSRINIKFHVYILVSRPKIDELLIGGWDPYWETYGIKEDPSAINLIITDELADSTNPMPPTAWMILHMLCQVTYEINNEKPFLDLWMDMLSKAYGPNINKMDTRKIMVELFTFRSARLNKLETYAEGLIDLMVDSLIHKKLSRNEFPVSRLPGFDPNKANELWDIFADEFSKQTYLETKLMRGMYVFL